MDLGGTVWVPNSENGDVEAAAKTDTGTTVTIDYAADGKVGRGAGQCACIFSKLV